jgi:hypothetical protein
MWCIIPSVPITSPSTTHTGGHSYLKPTHNKMHITLLAAAVGDMIFAVVTTPCMPRIGPFLRICLLANRSSDIRREMWLLACILPGLSSVLLLTLITLFFFSFFGLVLFHDISPHYFGNFPRAWWQLWVLMTTSNFPDVRSFSLATTMFLCAVRSSRPIRAGSCAVCHVQHLDWYLACMRLPLYAGDDGML